MHVGWVVIKMFSRRRILYQCLYVHNICYTVQHNNGGRLCGYSGINNFNTSIIMIRQTRGEHLRYIFFFWISRHTYLKWTRIILDAAEFCSTHADVRVTCNVIIRDNHFFFFFATTIIIIIFYVNADHRCTHTVFFQLV